MASILDAKVQSYIALYSGIISTLSPILILLVLPPHRVGRVTDWGENTLFCYLVHPFGLKLVYKPLLPVLLFAANGVAFAPLRNLLLFLILSVLPLVDDA